MYRYDPAGNRILEDRDGKRKEATYNSLNQIATLNGMPFSYDADGNMTHEPLSRHWVRRYQHDAENQVTRTWVERLARPLPCHFPAWHDEDEELFSDEPEGGDDGDDDRSHGSGKGHDKHGGVGPKPPPPPKRKHLRAFEYSAENLRVLADAWPGSAWKDRAPWQSEAGGGPKRPAERELRFWSGGQVAEDVSFTPAKRAGDDPKHLDHRFYLRAGGDVLHELADREKRGRLDPQEKEDRIYVPDVLGSTMLQARLHGPDSPGRCVTLPDLFGFFGSTWLPQAFGRGHDRDDDHDRRGPRRRPKLAVDRFSYTPYGEQTDGDSQAPWTFTGLRNEDVGEKKPGMLAAMYRDYRPGLGRWTRRDPAGAVDGPNLYAYVANRVTTATDERGDRLKLANLADRGSMQAILGRLRDAMGGEVTRRGRGLRVLGDGTVEWCRPSSTPPNGGPGEELLDLFIDGAGKGILVTIGLGSFEKEGKFGSALVDVQQGTVVGAGITVTNQAAQLLPGSVAKQLRLGASTLAHELLHVEHAMRLFGSLPADFSHLAGLPSAEEQRRLYLEESPEFHSYRRTDGSKGYDEVFVGQELFRRFQWRDPFFLRGRLVIPP